MSRITDYLEFSSPSDQHIFDRTVADDGDGDGDDDGDGDGRIAPNKYVIALALAMAMALGVGNSQFVPIRTNSQSSVILAFADPFANPIFTNLPT